VAITIPGHLDPWIAARDAVTRLRERGVTVVWGGPAATAAAAHGLPGEVAPAIDEAVAAVIRHTERPR
jgi:hypothetical protein